MSRVHRAAILPNKGGPMSITERATPQPGDGEVLIEVKSIALNLVDFYQATYGMPPVPIYPAVIGSDTAGVVAQVGTNVERTLKPGTRVLALATSFYEAGLPDYGAFQQFALAKQEGIITLPASLSFEEGSVFPLAWMTALTALTTIDISLDTRYKPSDKQGILIWGGASSVGTFAVQFARFMGFTVYTTASPHNHEYMKKLGAHTVFDYNTANVVNQIIEAVKMDGTTLVTAHCVVKDGLQPTLDVLKETKGAQFAYVSHSPVLPEDHPKLDGTEIKFNFPPIHNKALLYKHMKECFMLLKECLSSGSVIPSPKLQIEDGGLDGIGRALSTLNLGISAQKIVLSI